MKVGILTYHRSHNYGAFLQAYSLSRKINSLPGFSCEILNYNLSKEDDVYKKKKWKRPLYLFQFLKQDIMFEKAQQEQLLSGNLLLDDDYSDVMSIADEKYDIIVVGSDEVWRIASRGFPNAYWLPGDHNFVKMSYAASGRNPQSKLTSEVLSNMKKLYADFSYIGVRDEITLNQTQSLVDNLKVERNCDPVFFYDRYKDKNSARTEICNKWGLNPNRKIVAVFYDRPNLITKLRMALGKSYQFICITRPMWNADKNLCHITPFEWADVIGGADFLVTAYFHGMLFAINQNTPFVAIDRRAGRSNLETSKLYDFISYSGLGERYYISSDILEQDWVSIANKIKEESQSSVDFHEIVDTQKSLFASFERKLWCIKNEREK